MREVSVVTLAAACATAATPAYPDGSATATHRYYEVQGSKLYVETFGSGAPIVFLHGGLGFFDMNFAKATRLLCVVSESHRHRS
jgi:pimeloyl-ACP methyl ester carboxylesterase